MTDQRVASKATNLRPDSYRVRDVTHTSFKKVRADGVVVRTGGVARVEPGLSLARWPRR
jgi:hypothetical protein